MTYPHSWEIDHDASIRVEHYVGFDSVHLLNLLRCPAFPCCNVTQ